MLLLRLRPPRRNQATRIVSESAEGIAYAEKLATADIAHTHVHAPDIHYNFPVHPGTVARFPQSIAALNEIAGWLQATVRNQAVASPVF